MRYTITIQQAVALEWGLHDTEAYIFAYLVDLHTWAETMIYREQVWYFASRNKTLDELPLLDIKPDTVYRVYKSLDKKGVIQYLKKHKKDWILITEKGKDWNRKKLGFKSETDPNSDSNPDKLGFKSEKNSDSNPTDKYTSNDKGTSNEDAATGAAPKRNIPKEMATEFDRWHHFVISGKLIPKGDFVQQLQSGEADGIDWTGKEFKSLEGIRKIIEKRMKKKRIEGDIMESWSLFLEAAVNLNDNFIIRNFTPATLLSQFNNIVTKTKMKLNGKAKQHGISQNLRNMAGQILD